VRVSRAASALRRHVQHALSNQESCPRYERIRSERPLWGRFVFHNAADCTVVRTFPIEAAYGAVSYFPTPGGLPVALREKTTKDTDGRWTRSPITQVGDHREIDAENFGVTV